MDTHEFSVLDRYAFWEPFTAKNKGNIKFKEKESNKSFNFHSSGCSPGPAGCGGCSGGGSGCNSCGSCGAEVITNYKFGDFHTNLDNIGGGCEGCSGSGCTGCKGCSG